MTRRFGILIGGLLVAWLVLAGGAFLMGGSGEALLASAALGVCVVPIAATLLVAELLAVKHPELVGIVTLAGGVLQMVVIGAAALLLKSQVEFFQVERWNAWVVAFFLIALTLQTTAIAVGRVAPPPAS